MADDDDIPDSACKRRYCPACIITLREYCANKTDYCDESCCELYHEFVQYDPPQKICEEMKADCGGLCGQVHKNVQAARDLISANRATPYKLCKVLELC
ncbi:hypothetical protein Ddc_21188 [Ditylenchus destructor]|nr:hypothetical protein Ddc_21188 [Ditylenchus destructor]